ncbi:hypothetical protein KWG61_14540 [Allobaculum sp. Allo2]|nr:hypothetical protein KWG61_14540 [Allobaculum sp. Allo2]
MRSLHFRDAFPFRMEYRFTRSCLSDCAPDGFKNGLPCFVPGRGPCSPAAARTSFDKLSQLGSSYRNRWSTSEISQLTSEGVEQLEVWFGQYLPQFFYALLAPLTLFLIVGFLYWPAALVLFVCVPLIPVSIIAVQKFAKNCFPATGISTRGCRMTSWKTCRDLPPSSFTERMASITKR